MKRLSLSLYVYLCASKGFHEVQVCPTGEKKLSPEIIIKVCTNLEVFWVQSAVVIFPQ